MPPRLALVRAGVIAVAMVSYGVIGVTMMTQALAGGSVTLSSTGLTVCFLNLVWSRA